MPNLDLALLETFVTIADAGSLSAAAPRVCRSQSAVSEQLRKLEEACGVSLLVRGRAGTRLTPAGERLIVHARALIALSRRACGELHDMRLSGEVRLAVTDYFRPSSLAASLRRLRTLYPGLSLHVAIRESAAIDGGRGDFDIGLSMRLAMPSGRSDAPLDDGSLPLSREPLIWIADRSLDLADLPRLPLVVLSESCALRRLITRTLEREGIDYAVMHSASGVAGMHLALAAGLGITCLNASAVPAGMVDLGGRLSLPPLPDVEFRLTPPRPTDPALVREVRRVLAQELASPDLPRLA